MSGGLVSAAQRAVCERLGVEPVPAPPDLKVGISPNVRSDLSPINGLRHAPEEDTTGWYIWAGEIDAAEQGDDFFVQLHVAHVPDWCPPAVPYLALPPGWGFVVAPGHEDVWHDKGLLRRDAIARTAGSLDGVYEPGALDRLRDEWR